MEKYLLSITSVVLFVSLNAFAAAPTATEMLAQDGKMFATAGLSKLEGMKGVPGAGKVPFFLDSIDYLAGKDIKKFGFEYARDQTVKVRYGTQTLFSISRVNPKINAFLLDSYRMQLSKYKSFKDYLSVIQQIYNKPKVALKKESVDGAILVTALIGYSSVKNAAAKTYLAECKKKAANTETVMRKALFSCLPQVEWEFDKKHLESADKYMLSKFRDNYTTVGAKAAPIIDGLVVMGKKKKVFLRLNQAFYPKKETYVKYKFPNEGAITSAKSCQDQLLSSFDHLLLPAGKDWKKSLNSQLDKTIRKDNFKTDVTFWLYTNRRRKEFTKCLEKMVGKGPVSKPKQI